MNYGKDPYGFYNMEADRLCVWELQVLDTWSDLVEKKPD